MNPTDQQKKLAELITEAGPKGTVALTGAGISTPSGIPDFRSDSGVWADVDPMEVAHIQVFNEDPEKFWEFYSARLDVPDGVMPNPAHKALTELEERGLLSGVITQNVDGLHTKAGSQTVHEVHGSTQTLICMVCNFVVDKEEAKKRLFVDGMPYCPTCTHSILKPNVVLFGEMLPQEAFLPSLKLSEEAKLMLCIGTSLIVYPVASFPSHTLETGGEVAIINAEETPYDEQSLLRLSDDVADELSGVIAAL